MIERISKSEGNRLAYGLYIIVGFKFHERVHKAISLSMCNDMY